MLQKTLLTGLSILTLSVFTTGSLYAAHHSDKSYVVDSSGNVVMSAAGCVVSGSPGGKHFAVCHGDEPMVMKKPAEVPMVAPTPKYKPMVAPRQVVKVRS